MERQPQNFKRSGRAHLLLGIVLMFLGLFLIADLANIFHMEWRLRDFLFTWQALLILLGIIFLSNRENKGTGVILIAIGAFFLLPNIAREIRSIDLPDYWGSLFWPTILIVLGVVIIFSTRRHGGAFFGHRRTVSTEDYLDDVAIFGGGDKNINSQNFQGGKITHIFGGSKYDFSKARMANGKNYLELVMIFGGTKLLVPEDWDVKVEVTSIFGGFSDKRVRSGVVKDPDRSLVITGSCIFGGGEITNYL
jgi:predicted membrane protein